MLGKDFLAKFPDDDDPVAGVDPLSRVVPEVEYPVLDAMEFAVQSTFFARLIHSLLEGCAFADKPQQEAALRQVGQLMLMAHHSYAKMGLGHVLSDSIVDLVMSLEGVYGARASGGGSGGTIVILCHENALPLLEGIAAKYKTKLILT